MSVRDDTSRSSARSAGARSPRPRLLAWAVGLLLLIVLLGPAALAALFSWTSFTGCAISCTPPQPAIGVAMALVTASILALPVLAGAVVRRRRRPPLTWRVVGVVVLLIAFCVALDAVA